MNPEIRNKLRNVVTQSRRELEKAVAQRLEGRFTIFLKGDSLTAERKASVGHLSDEERAVRLQVLEHFDLLESQGINKVDAYRQLVREVAFTWLNRFVAFKMLESRKLIRETIGRWEDSNGFKHWVTQTGREADLTDYERGGEYRSAAYHRFLLARCGELATEIRVLFDPDNLATRLAPPATALKQLAETLNTPDLAEAWQPGHEETLGWVYQDFNEADLEPLRGLSSFKVPAELIPAKTQKFTLRWVIEYLVHNTLGTLWLEMHPDSRLAEQLHYHIPRQVAPDSTPVRTIRFIRLLDPACGTMHFGLVAFDLFVEMYREECERAGQPGWPEMPPVASPEEIPAAILAHNLHGIDIDPRAVQISALALYLKAKVLAPRRSLSQSRLACANVHMLNGERLGAFLQSAGMTQRPIYGRILQALQEELQLSEQLGSLLPLEKRIRQLIEKERQRYEKEGRQPDIFGWSQAQFESEASQGKFWETLEEQVSQALDAFAKAEAERGHNQTYFAQETVQGLRLLELLGQTYDVVVTNPPFLDTRDMNDELKKLVDAQYPESKRNLYAPFVLRCLELAIEGGRIGVITGQTFMFIKTFEKFRALLAETCIIESLHQYDYGLFDGVRVDTAAYVLRKEPNAQRRQESIGTYFRLVKEPDAESKRRRFEQALRHLDTDPIIFRYAQKDFAAIPGSPWVYWIPPGLRRLFQTLPKLGDSTAICIGMRTGDNFRYLRFWWEVGQNQIAQNCKNAEEGISSRKTWFPYMKGGSFRRWYGNQDYVVKWDNDGEDIKNNTRKMYPELGDNLGWKISNESYYFRRGVTWTDLTSGRFSARLSPGGFIFDVSGSSAFPPNVELVLGLMNSTLAQYVFKLINPTVHVQVGDLARLPIPDQSSPRLEALVEQAITLAKQDSAEDETTWDFVAPPPWPDGLEKVAQRHAQLAAIEQQIDEEVYRLYGISDQDRAAIETELAESAPVTEDDDSPAVRVSGTESLENEEAPTSTPTDRTGLAHAWISFAVMKVFEQGTFWARHKLAEQVLNQLETLLGETAAAEVVTTACGTGSLSDQLTDDLGERFFKRHLQQYRKRPIYWLLQSPKKNFALWLHARQYDRDTLFKVLLNAVEPEIRLQTSRLDSLRTQKNTAGTSGKEAKRLAKAIEKQEELLSDLRDLEERLRRAANLHLDPDINDGVALNIAPLWELVPWKEAKKYWDELLSGKYEWSSISKQLREKGLVK
ncbi:BREX-1 system adenine-specific DNA-methyltransferase PglX [Gloeomargaritales cyanobacterium VI4D9]|nr:BREX-1 system adenine-specific DNA-methyltransferase PglX [Gloeomargaritales cyanobacterium VI4D9]